MSTSQPTDHAATRRRARRGRGDSRHTLVGGLVVLSVAVAAGAFVWWRSPVAAAPSRPPTDSHTGVEDRQAPLRRQPISMTQPSAPVRPQFDPDKPLPKPPADRLQNMVMVPAGTFLYGEEKTPVDLPAFYIDRFEVSQAQYADFLQYVLRTNDHSHCREDEPPGKDHTPLYWGAPQLSDPHFPVIGLDYWDVTAYAGWVGKRLPTEEEWEKAARGTDGRLFPWGEEWDPARCNWGPSPGDEHTLLPVDALPEGRSPYGCYNMLGNAAEWTGSFLNQDQHVHCGRGYCWALGRMKPYVVTYRMPGRAHLRDEGSGLRCALDAPAGDQSQPSLKNELNQPSPVD